MNFLLGSKFDYHLQPNEQNQVEHLVPDHQAKIHLAFRANVSFSEINSNSKKDYNGAAVALSEHMITICYHGFFGRSYKLLETFHVNDITELQSISEELTIIKIIKGIYYIDSPTSLRFARSVIRNYILSNPMMPPSLRFKFKAEDPSKFPKFNPPLSPSQQFQFTYNANCSYFNVSYYHDIPYYFHNLIITGSCIFDFTQLPIHLMECGLGQSTDIRPITSALMFDPYIYGINISDITRDDIISASAPIILMNPSLRIVRLIKTGSQKGGMMVSNAMNQSRHQSISYWDLSENQLEDMVYFADSLGRYKGQLITLRLNNCRMTNAELTTLISSLTDNHNDRGIKQLALIGNGFNQSNCDQFCDFLNAITSSTENSGGSEKPNVTENENELEDIEYQNDDPNAQLILTSSAINSIENENNRQVGGCSLYRLELGPVKNPGIIIKTLSDRLIPLKTLKIIDSYFDENTVRLFSNFLNTSSTLRELDISGSNIKDQHLGILLESLLSNASIEDGSLVLTLNRLNLRGGRYGKVKNALLAHSSKIGELSLNENGLSLNDSVIKDICQFQNLKKVSLAVNFTKKMAGVGSALASILDHSHIISLNISGNCQTGQIVGGYALESELLPFIKSLYTNSSLEELDISGNLVGDDAIKMINEIIIDNNILKVINIDDNAITNLNTITDFLDAVSKSTSIINAIFPVNDIYNILYSDNELEKDLESLSRRRQIVQKVMLNNMSKCGLYSSLSLLNDKTLNEIIDEATLELQEKFDINNIQVEKHAAITEIVGLPLPYVEDENQISVQTDSNMKEDLDNADATDEEVYASKQLMSTVMEPESKANSMASSFKTLQFNSLCIRRPDAQQKLEEKGKFLLQDVDMGKILRPSTFTSNLDNKNHDNGNDGIKEELIPKNTSSMPTDL